MLFRKKKLTAQAGRDACLLVAAMGGVAVGMGWYQILLPLGFLSPLVAGQPLGVALGWTNLAGGLTLAGVGFFALWRAWTKAGAFWRMAEPAEEPAEEPAA